MRTQVDVDSGIENMEVDENDRREKRSLSDKVSEGERAPGFSVLSLLEAAMARAAVCG